MARTKGQAERQIQNAVLDWLGYQKYITALPYDNKGGFDPNRGVFRTRGRHYIKGVADIVAWFKSGHIVFIEVKTLTGNLSISQKEFRRICESSGAFYIIVRSVDDVIAQIEHIKDHLIKEGLCLE